MEFIEFETLDKDQKWIKFLPFVADLDKDKKIFFKPRQNYLWINLSRYKMVEHCRVNKIYSINSADEYPLFGKFVL